MTKLNVLLADDEHEFAGSLAERLEMRGMTVCTAASGEQVLALLESTSVDVVVVDVKMPGMGGLAALEEIRERYPELPVIMLSGHAHINTAVSAMDGGAFDYLVKPVPIDELMYRIQDAHKNKQADDSLD